MNSFWIVQEDGDMMESFSNTITVKNGTKGGGKWNGLWHEGDGLSVDLPGPQYFELTIDQDVTNTVWFGLVDEKNFGSGWKCHGLMYGGNLSDGGGLKRQRFGPRPMGGDVIGMRIEIKHDKVLSIFFSFNGKGLGEGFHISDFGNAGPFYPVVSFNQGPGKASIVRKQAPAESLMKLSLEEERTSIEGIWTFCGSEIIAEATGNLTVTIGPGKISCHVANNLGVAISKEKPYKSTSLVMSTMMLPSPDMLELEKAVGDILSNINDIDLVDGNTLKITHHDNQSFLLKSHIIVHEPVEAKEIRWLNKK